MRQGTSGRDRWMGFAVLIGGVLWVLVGPVDPAAPRAGHGGDAMLWAASTPGDAANPRAAALYRQHCVGCHGESGDGKGVAATFLDPKPRNFRAGGFRLISSASMPPSPSTGDLLTVLNRGMPGSSMVSWAHLSQEDRRLLAEHVLFLRREGARELKRKLAEEEGEEPTDEEIAEYVQSVTTAGPELASPQFGVPTAERIARGKEIYLAKGCASCHGKEGKGDGAEKMLTSEGYPQKPRDLTLGIFKGEPDAAALYRRIRIGLPGSSMPSTPAAVLSDDQAVDLVHYLRSLSSDSDREQWVMHRRKIVAAATVVAPTEPDAEAWKGIAPIGVALAKLWWEPAFRDPQLSVQAVHDGKQLVLRLSWKDDSANDRVLRPEDFEDMAAVEIHRGVSEPFLGMGSKDAAVDMWLWRAGWSRPYPPQASMMDEYPFEKAVKGFSRQGGPPPDFLTARAAGNLHSNPDRSLSASSLTAKGAGSTTFRPKRSQSATAKGVYSEGRWSVVLRRPLEVQPDDGVSLKPGERVSVAFALWNGAFRDRNGQKAISLWNDLVLAPTAVDQKDSERAQP